MLDANLKTQLQSYLERITQPIEIVASLDDSETSREMQALLKDIAAASPLVTVDARAATTTQRKPSFSINRPGENRGVALRRPADGP